jgi:hypothetical protein
MMTHLEPTDYVREISSGTSSATDMKSTTHRSPCCPKPPRRFSSNQVPLGQCPRCSRSD